MNFPVVTCALNFSGKRPRPVLPSRPEPGGPEMIPFKIFAPDARNSFVCIFFGPPDSESSCASMPVPASDPMVRIIAPLQQTFSGYWSGHVPLPPGRHEYLFLVNGNWMADPDAVETCSDGIGGEHGVRTVVAGEQLAAVARVATGFAIANHRGDAARAV